MKDNLGVGIMSSVNLKERYTACRLTWTKDFDNVYIFAGHNADKIDNNLISIDGAGEDWNSSFLKQQLGLKYIYENNSNYDWYSISGCDTILFKNKLIEELKNYNSNEDFLISQKCGIWSEYPYLHEVGNKNSNSFYAIAGGASFFISNSLMKKCYSVIDEFNKYWTMISSSGPKWLYGCSDIALALMIKKYFNIEVTENIYLFSQNPTHYENVINNENCPNRKYYTDINNLSNRILTPISFHYIKPNEMEEVYKKYK